MNNKQLIDNMEGWYKWEPGIAKLKEQYHFKRLDDKIDMLHIYLISKCFNQKVKISFDSSWAYRNVYETFRLNLITQLSEKYGKEFYATWSFFKIENSSYLKWISEQSRGYTDGLNLKHFVIIGIDFIVDVVATEEPRFKIISNKG